MNNDEEDNTDDSQFRRTIIANYMLHMNNTLTTVNNTITLLSDQNQNFNNIMNYNEYFNYRNMRSNRNNRNFNIPRWETSSFTIPILRNFSRYNSSTEEPIRNLIGSISYLLYSDCDASANTTCPITQHDFNDNDIVIKINNCGHIFEPQAIMQWFARNHNCPMCRGPIISRETNNTSNNTNNISDNTSDNIESNTNTTINNNIEENTSNIINPRIPNNSLLNFRNIISNPTISNTFSQQLANIISNRIQNDGDLSGNIQIELDIDRI